jgi:glycosyltransferase involved in cell wall biosynthesis
MFYRAKRFFDRFYSGKKKSHEINSNFKHPEHTQKQILLDISALVVIDLKTGIQRVVRSILKEWLNNPPEGYKVEPVYATPTQGYRYARQFAMNFLGHPIADLKDEPIAYKNGDKFIVLDWYHAVTLAHRNFYQQMRQQGVEVQFVIYDILPLLMKQFFPDFVCDAHYEWTKIATENDGVICISNSVAQDVKAWLENNGDHRSPCKVSWFHLGADIAESSPTFGMPEGSGEILKTLSEKPTFLMVGTVEPRKGHAQTFAAFEKLWANGSDSTLVIVGSKGWQVEELINKIQTHSQLGKRLFWFEGISDEYLEKIYAASRCVIVASEGEGFGLPLIEAAKHRIPLIARDLPVFKEVAGHHAFYFTGTDPQNLAEAIESWLVLDQQGISPSSKNMPWQTWKQSAQQLWHAIIQNESNVMLDIESEVA